MEDFLRVHVQIFKNTFILAIILFIIALIPRFYLLNEAEIFPDEITWTVRSKEVFEALRTPNFGYFSNAWWNKKTDTEATAIPLTLAGGLSLRLFGQTISTHSFKLLTDIESVRLPVVIFTAIFIVVLFYYLRFLVDTKLAFFTSLLLAIDPIFLSLSRWALNDGLLTVFMTISLISYIADTKNKRFTPVPGIFLALSLLTKPNGFLPVIGWLVVTLLVRNYPKKLVTLSINLIIFAALVYLLWPSMWSNPLYVFEYIIRQTQLTQTGISNYFFGIVTNNPPFYYYLFQIVTRLPSFVLIGFAGLIFTTIYEFVFLKKKLTDYSVWLPIIVYSIIFLITISVSPKKLGVRYVLPIWPWIYLGSILWFKKVSEILIPKYSYLTFVFLICLSIFTIISYTPKFYFYYNVFIGGPSKAQGYDLPNICLGSQKTADYINNYQSQVNKIIYLGCGSTTFPFYSAVPITTNTLVKSDLIILEDSYMKLKPNEPIIKTLKLLEPLAVISDKGIILARVYK